MRLAIACWWAWVRGPGNEIGRGTRSVSLITCSLGSGVSESELLAEVSEVFGSGRVSEGGVQSMCSLMGASRNFREDR